MIERPEDQDKYSSWMTSVFDKGVNLQKLRYDMQKFKTGSFNTINHLDPWFNNMLFKYDQESGILQDVLLLDFQGTGYCNVGNDLAHFFLSSTTKKFRDGNLNQMLRLYHETLLKTIHESSGKALRYAAFCDLT